MFENEADAVRLGIKFLTAINEKDYLLDPNFDVLDLESKLDEIQGDVNNLISNLPVESIDDDEELEEEYLGDFEDSEELEDEVVECERLIIEATELLAAVREHYLPREESLTAVPEESVQKPIVTTSLPDAPKPQVSRRKRLPEDSEFRLFVVVLLALIVIISLIVEQCQ